MRWLMLLIGVGGLSCATGTNSPPDALVTSPDSMTGMPDSGVLDTNPPPDTARADAGFCPMTCLPGQVCIAGVCMDATCGPDVPCLPGLSCCGARCVSLPTDPLNCGACDRPCGTRGQTCESGQCKCNGGTGCTASQTCCTSGCEDTQTDPMNCGMCGRMCPEDQVCMMGDCVPPPCNPACRDGETCDANTLSCRCGTGVGCAPGQGCCNDSCIDTAADNANCGRCGNVCPIGQDCVGGTCSMGPAACEPACGTGESCVAGVCQCGTGPACVGDTECCGGACIDVSRDTQNCGFCNRRCAASESCCSGTCTTTQNNPDHCGMCGNDCTDNSRTDTCTGNTCTCQGAPECGLLQQCIPFLGCLGF